MDTKDRIDPTNEEKLFSGVLWLNVKAFGLALGLICGFFLFVITNWLIIKGGNPIGPHLVLLSQFFVGYRVSFVGSIIGFFYGFAVGTLGGATIGWIYNTIVRFRN
jgi:hypothetical protein